MKRIIWHDKSQVPILTVLTVTPKIVIMVIHKLIKKGNGVFWHDNEEARLPGEWSSYTFQEEDTVRLSSSTSSEVPEDRDLSGLSGALHYRNPTAANLHCHCKQSFSCSVQRHAIKLLVKCAQALAHIWLDVWLMSAGWWVTQYLGYCQRGWFSGPYIMEGVQDTPPPLVWRSNNTEKVIVESAAVTETCQFPQQISINLSLQRLLKCCSYSQMIIF